MPRSEYTVLGRLLEADRCCSENLSEKTPISPPDWEMLIEQIASEINGEHTPAMILKARSKLYDLLTHCIPATTILKTLAWKLLPKIDPILRPEVIKWAAFYEHRVRQGSVSTNQSELA